MKHKIIKASELGVDCWSTRRFFGKCHDCCLVKSCKLPEARIGRIMLAEKKMKAAKENLAQAKKELENEIDKHIV